MYITFSDGREHPIVPGLGTGRRVAVVFATDLGHAPRSGLAVYVAQTRPARGAAMGSSAGAGPSGSKSAADAAAPSDDALWRRFRPAIPCSTINTYG